MVWKFAAILVILGWFLSLPAPTMRALRPNVNLN